MIVTMSEDSRNNLWLGTWPTGMCRFDKTTGKSKRYYEKEGGLIDNSVCKIIPDDDGYLWVATKNGICKFNPVDETFLEYYYAEDGLQSNEFLFDAGLKATDGTIYFGGSNGVNYLEPEKIYKNKIFDKNSFVGGKWASMTTAQKAASLVWDGSSQSAEEWKNTYVTILGSHYFHQLTGATSISTRFGGYHFDNTLQKIYSIGYQENIFGGGIDPQYSPISNLTSVLVGELIQ